MKLDQDQSDFVEKMGRFWESMAGTRTAGRILGWLMISEPDTQSSVDLVSALDVSTGSVSSQIRQLEQIGLVERVTFPGDRSSYYRLPDHVWSRMLNDELDRIVEMRKVSEAGVEVLPQTRPDRVTELGKVAGFFEREWPVLMNRLDDDLKKERTV